MNTFRSRGLLGYLLLIMSCLLALGPNVEVNAAEADIRVLLHFSATGHRIIRVVNPQSGRLTPGGRLARQMALARSAPQKLVRELESGQGGPAAMRLAQVIWTDRQGNELRRVLTTDPRLTHAPISLVRHGSDQARHAHVEIQYTARTEGVYLLSGPAAAEQLVISLPAMQLNEQPLFAEQWVLRLY